MQRTYLCVPPEEYAQVGEAGAVWDGAGKRWYIPDAAAVAPFTRWLRGASEEVQFGVSSEHAFVVSALTACLTCQAEIEVIALFCERGIDEERSDMIERVTLSNLWDVDEGLKAQLTQWACYKRGNGTAADAGMFANHCMYCGAMQDDLRLHSEPGDVFFSVTEAEPGSLSFTPLVGRVRMSGDFGFGL